MKSTLSLQFGLEDILADLRHCRRQNDIGRLALIAYCEVRRWAREAGDTALAERASALMAGSPYPSREVFLARIDDLIHELEHVSRLVARSAGALPAGGDSHGAM